MQKGLHARLVFDRLDRARNERLVDNVQIVPKPREDSRLLSKTRAKRQQEQRTTIQISTIGTSLLYLFSEPNIAS